MEDIILKIFVKILCYKKIKNIKKHKNQKIIIKNKKVKK